MNGGEDSQELVTKDLEHLGGLELFILSQAMDVVPLLEEVLHVIPKISIGRKLHKLLRTDFIIKRLHLLTLAATNATKLFEKLTSVTIASLHKPLVLGVMDETDDGVEGSFAHILPNRFSDIVRTSRQVKEFSIADRRTNWVEPVDPGSWWRSG